MVVTALYPFKESVTKRAREKKISAVSSGKDVEVEREK